MKFSAYDKVERLRRNSNPCELGHSGKDKKTSRNNKPGMRFVRGQTEFEMDRHTMDKLGHSLLTAFKYALAAVVTVVLITAVTMNLLAQNPGLWGIINWQEIQGGESREQDQPDKPVEDDHLFP